MNYKKIIKLLLIATLLIFIGRGMQMIIWNAPFRTFFWNETLLKPIVEKVFDTSWNNYATNTKVDDTIQLFIKLNGVVLLIASIASLLLYNTKKRIYSYIIYTGVLVLFFLAILEFQEKFMQFPQLFEASLQVTTPIFFSLYILDKITNKKLLFYLKIMIAITFTSHGLYALGLYATPGNFVDMFIVILNVTETVATILLKTVGIIDILIAILLFIPNKKIVKYSLLYAFIWGILTALARLFFNMQINDFEVAETLKNIYSTLFRMCHGLIPLACIYIIKTIKEPLKSKKDETKNLHHISFSNTSPINKG